MKNAKTIYIVLAVITLLVLAAAVYCLVISICGKGAWALTASLGLICVGNGLILISQRIRKKRGE